MWQQIKRWTRRSATDESGQSMVIIAVAFVALLVIIGLAIDLGLMYVERIKLGRACDAAALAASQDLPFEEFAARRAIQYLTENGYDPNNAELIVLGPANADSLSWGPPADSKGTITIDMESYEDPDMKKQSEKDNSADKIRVHGRVNVPMNFMRLVGFDTVPVEAQAIAENVSNLDIIIVYDESGSMNDDTYCYRDGERPCYIQGDNEYPAGERLYVPWADWITEPVQPLVYDGREILVAEAEYFSYSTSFGEHPYYRDFYEWPDSFWMIQRTEDSQASGYRYERDDRRGAHLMHMPHRSNAPGHDTAGSSAPRLDYNFHIPEPIVIPSQWYVWIRAQCGRWSGNSSRVDGCTVHWGADGTYIGSTDGGDFDPGSGVNKYGGSERGSNRRYWEWIRLGSVTQTDRDVQINIWGGGAGFRLDKVIITRHSEGQQPNSNRVDDHAPLFIQNTTPSWNDVRNDQYQTYELGEWFGGPADTRGKDGLAALKCNPIYGLRINDGCTPGQAPDAGCDDLDGNGTVDYYEICDNTLDDMYDDQQPIRASKEAAKNFLKRLRARFDQVGFVGYSTSYNQDVLRELNCIKTPARAGTKPMPDSEGVWDPQTGPDPAWIWCYDHRRGQDGYSSDSRLSDTTHGSIVGAIEDMHASGMTNIADGMREAMETLGSTTGHYGRPNAVKIMILLTDGVANRWPGYNQGCRSGSCCEEDWFQPNDGNHDENRAADCVIYYAKEAKNNGIVVYTIGLGLGADGDLLQAVADETGGRYYFAPKGKDLDRIFQEIADQIFLRLVE